MMLAACAWVGLSASSHPAVGQCNFVWTQRFFPPKLGGNGLDGCAYALTEFDDGSAPALHADGEFGSAGGVSANRIAKWDGAAWSPLGSGMEFQVRALTVFDDGAGPALYAGGHFTTAGNVASSRIARWGSRCRLGDLNCDGTVNPDDIGPFALAMTDPAAYSAAYPGCEIDRADLNRDDLVNGHDLPLFVAALLGP